VGFFEGGDWDHEGVVSNVLFLRVSFPRENFCKEGRVPVLHLGQQTGRTTKTIFGLKHRSDILGERPEYCASYLSFSQTRQCCETHSLTALSENQDRYSYEESETEVMQTLDKIRNLLAW
jgi:hypothetical protein